MYDRYKLCQMLKPKEYCIIVEQYKDGLFEQKFHEHVAVHRLSEESLQSLLPALVMKFAEMLAMMIFPSHLNSRGKNPLCHDFMWHVDYPEPGVLRKYCGTNTRAWADRVIRADQFRK